MPATPARGSCMPSFRLLTALACLACAPLATAAVVVDGRLSPGEWDGARHVTDFRLLQPLTGEPATLATEAWVLATPEGLAVAFRNTQPADVPRTTQRTRRDQMGQQDRVNVMVDFDGDGRTGYDFVVSITGGIGDEVITSERNFNDDWDGHWHSATSQDDQAWYAEILVPWHVAPMSAARDGRRTLGLYLDRVVGSTGERFGWPDASYQRTRFLSEFSKVEVPHFNQALLAVTPYAVASHDIARGGGDVAVGADLFWKPSGQFQLAATLNPDFGQVESDDLVVNFSAVESFFGDKRPFFTENQALFDVPFGTGNSRLLYTRRIGGPADDRSGQGDVRAAVKLNGSLGDVRYGVLAASEGEAVGRDFIALRATRDFGNQDVGAMLTRVDSPYLDRRADVYSTDHLWTPTAGLSLRTQLVVSDVVQAGARSTDSGFQARLDQDFGGGWRQQVYFLHLGDQLQLNDIGYIDRNDFNYLRYELARRDTDLPAASSYSSHDWRWAASTRRNDHGLVIAHAAAVNRYSERRDGGNEYLDVGVWTEGFDDRITRGNGVLRVPEKLFLYWERERPQRGAWSWDVSASANADGLDGARGLSPRLEFEPTLHLSDSLVLELGLALQHNPDWLLWRGGDRVGSFRADTSQLSAGLQWQWGARQELRVKFEALAVDARLRQAWQVGPGGRPVPVAATFGDFSLANLGFQVRYRYELAPLSDLYVVYGRGGLDDQGISRPLAELLGDATSLRDDEQILVKLSYRFAN